MNKAFKIDTGNESLHSIGGIYLGGQVLQKTQVNDEFRDISPMYNSGNPKENVS